MNIMQTATTAPQYKRQQAQRMQSILAITYEQSCAFLRAGLAERQAAIRRPGMQTSGVASAPAGLLR